jgi:NAD(P)-dependent dehydrogenase (short-subunit alcohol dehydrogenase family)
MARRCLVIGAGDGIGLALVGQLAEDGAYVVGVSRRPAPTGSAAHENVVLDVTDASYRASLGALYERLGPFDAGWG